MNDNVTLNGKGDVTLDGGSIAMSDAVSLAGTNDVKLTGKALTLENDVILNGNAMILDGGDSVTMNNKVGLTATGDMSITGDSIAMNDNVTLTGKGDVTLDGGSIAMSDAVSLAGTNDVKLTGKALTLENDVILNGNAMILDGGDSVTMNNKVGLTATGDMSITGDSIAMNDNVTLNGKENITLDGGSIAMSDAVSLAGEGDVTLDGNTLTVGNGANLLGEEVVIQLDGLAPDGKSWVVINDGATLRTHDGRPVAVVGSGLDSDSLDFSTSELPGTWTISGKESGSFHHDNLDFAFSAIEKIEAGRADDVTYLQGTGNIDAMTLGDGYNTIDGSALSSRTTWNFNNESGHVVAGNNAVTIGTLRGVDAIIGSQHGDELSYDDPLVFASWLVELPDDNSGTLNGMRFSNITTATQVSSSSMFELLGHMDTINIQAVPATLCIYPCGYFNSLAIASGTIVIDMRPVHRPQIQTPISGIGIPQPPALSGFTPGLMPLPGMRSTLEVQSLDFPHGYEITFPAEMAFILPSSSSGNQAPVADSRDTQNIPEEPLASPDALSQQDEGDEEQGKDDNTKSTKTDRTKSDDTKHDEGASSDTSNKDSGKDGKKREPKTQTGDGDKRKPDTPAVEHEGQPAQNS